MKTDDNSILTEPAQGHESTFKLVLSYLLRKGLMVFSTIFIGVFLTIILINRPVKDIPYYQPQLDAAITSGIDRAIRNYRLDNFEIFAMTPEEQAAIINPIYEDLVRESGINQPYLLKHLKWTFNALSFKWGRLSFSSSQPLRLGYGAQTQFTLNDIILQYLPMTLLVMGVSYLLIFLLGMPLALYLSQHRYTWYDKLVSLIAPISSVPAWVIGILLITIFALELRILPIGGMFDTMPPKTPWGYIPIILKHMILPVSAVILSVFFQLVYSWRTVFVTFGDEDYVEHGKAVGLKPRKWRRNYLLKPSLPFVITNFSLILVSFWQMNMALESVFSWKGIGWLYVKVGLPNFWGETMYPGELLIALQLVVLFAFITGIIVFMLDIIYVLVDPRIRLAKKEPPLWARIFAFFIGIIIFLLNIIYGLEVPSILGMKKDPSLTTNQKRAGIKDGIALITLKLNNFKKLFASYSVPNIPKTPWSLRHSLNDIFETIHTGWISLVGGLRVIFRSPTAIFGLLIIMVLIGGSIYAFIAIPYSEIGEEWGRANLTGMPAVPKLAKPAWINAFREDDYLSTLKLLSIEGDAIRTELVQDNGNRVVSLLFEFDYPYSDFPSDLSLYLEGIYQEKTPFVWLTWITPDGREIKLSGTAVDQSATYDFSMHLNARRMVSANPNLAEWFQLTGNYTTPTYHLLFADPEVDTPHVVQGKYQLLLEGMVFEEDSDFQADLTLLGQVYGLAGTDVFRRDLIVPLFWGMPIALLIGLVGSLVTTILSMIIAATGVWIGGWVDDFFQRLTEVNLILPMMAIIVLGVAYLNINVWMILVVMVFLNIFGSPLKSFRSVLLQIREAPYIESARAYGSSNTRIIFKYMVPKIIPVLIPQLIFLIPSFVFLEATLGMFNISTGLPTWGTMIYQGLTSGALFGSRYWVLQPLALLLLTGIAFALLGNALEKILNPRLQEK